MSDTANDGWAHYFPFDAGQNLRVEARYLFLRLNGDGTVLARSAEDLELTFTLPETDLGITSIPETQARIRLTYRGEGHGNSLEADINGREIRDDNILIASEPERRHRQIDRRPEDPEATALGFTLIRDHDQRATLSNLSGISSKLPSGLEIRITPASA